MSSSTQQDNATAPSVVVSSMPRYGGGGYGQLHNGLHHVLGAIHNDTGHVMNGLNGVQDSIHSNSRANGDAIGSVRYEIAKNAGDIGKEILQAVSADTNFTNLTSNQLQNVLSSAIERNGDMVGNSVERNADHLGSAIERNGDSVADAVHQNGTRNLMAIQQTSRDVLLGDKDMLIELCKVDGKLERQAAENKEQIRLDLCKTKGHLSEQSTRGFLKCELDSQKNKCEILSALSSGLCDIKERLCAQEVSRLRDDLAVSRNANTLAAILAAIGGTALPAARV